jgi:hypothetical protein
VLRDTLYQSLDMDFNQRQAVRFLPIRAYDNVVVVGFVSFHQFRSTRIAPTLYATVIPSFILC